MTDAQLTSYGAWASIIGVVVSVLSLLYVRSIKTNIIRFRRKQRRQELIDDVILIDRIGPLSPKSEMQLLALKRNIPIYAWSRFTPQGKARIEVHKRSDEQNIVALIEALRDLSTFSEDI